MRRLSTRKPVIGLVGGVGAGKSTVARQFARLGAAVVDGDAIGHDLLESPAVRREVRRRWGGGVFTRGGRVSRAALGRVVFAAPAELEALNRILHPRIRRRMERAIAQARRDPAVPAVVVDAAVLFEAGWDDLCTAVVFVKAPAARRARRWAARHGGAKAAWRRRENAQISLDKKRQKCEYTVDNSSSVSRLPDQVRTLLLRFTRAAERPRR